MSAGGKEEEDSVTPTSRGGGLDTRRALQSRTYQCVVGVKYIRMC